MNMDFHYYGTYLAARGAQFSDCEARKIAWASQMTDDCTETLLKQMNVPEEKRVFTCQTNEEMLVSNMKDLSDQNSQELRKIRSIWMPFHFLPGNFDNRYRYEGEKEWGTTKYDEVRDEEDFRCICTINSELVQRMIDDIRNRYNEADNDTKDELLYLIGIRMHVLADTWAHEFFAGTPNYWVNEDEWKERVDGPYASPFTAPDAFSYYSIFYLGHGQVGHWPDYSHLTYRYLPHWMKKDSNGIFKSNPDIFYSAFYQMMEAMKAIKQNENFDRQMYMDKEDTVIIANLNVEAGEVLTVLKSDKQPTAWKDFVENKIQNTIEYKIDDQNYKIEDFCTWARVHRDLVVKYVNSKSEHIQL